MLNLALEANLDQDIKHSVSDNAFYDPARENERAKSRRMASALKSARVLQPNPSWRVRENLEEEQNMSIG